MRNIGSRRRRLDLDEWYFPDRHRDAVHARDPGAGETRRDENQLVTMGRSDPTAGSPTSGSRWRPCTVFSQKVGAPIS
jgi:hypothetical protein